jgi:outer membrane protein OmpA-like peptidoglycan-associated protein
MKFNCIKIQPYFLFLFLTISLPSYSQNKIQLVEIEIKGENYITSHEYQAALAIFSKLDSLQPNTQRYLYKMGICNLLMNENLKAVKLFERCKSFNEEQPSALDYYLAKAYHMSHWIDKASAHYSIFINKVKDENNKKLYKFSIKADKELLEQLLVKAERELINCKNAKELMANPLKLEVVNLGPTINTEYSEYAPVISADETELIFTSTKPIKRKEDKIKPDSINDEDVYLSNKINGKWTVPVQMSSNINTSTHDASIALSPDGQTLFLYRFDEYTENPLNASGNIFTSKLKGTEWTIAERLNDKVNSPDWEPSASLTENGTTLFFASNRRGGKGGTDLYFSKKLSDGSWDEAINMGDNINTLYNDDCPFIHPDGKTLYFSSKGHNSMGGYDIFISKWDSTKNTWGKPENMGYPISTAGDDLHFAISPNATRIYFASIREEGLGNMDIYYANIENKESAKVLLMTGIVTDSISAIPVEVVIRTKDKNNKEEISTHKSNSSTGKYTLVLNDGKNYDLIFSSPKFGSHYENIDLTNETEYKEITKDIVLKKRDRNIIMQVDDVDSNQSVNAKVSIVNCDSGEEIILDAKSEVGGTYFVKLKEGNCYSIEISKEDYIFSSMEIHVPMIEEENGDTIIYHLKLQPIKEGTTLLLRNIYFASNEFMPLATSYPELDRLAIFMKQNTGTTIEISAHTDNTGNPEYNLKLSDKRAKAVIAYLVEKGISASRLKSVGHGNSKPISTGNSEEDKQKNRRVELKILKID